MENEMSRGKKLLAPISAAGVVAAVAVGGFALGAVNSGGSEEPERVNIVDVEQSSESTPTPTQTPAPVKKRKAAAKQTQEPVSEPVRSEAPETIESQVQEQETVVTNETPTPEPTREATPTPEPTPSYHPAQGNNPDAPPVSEELENYTPPSGGDWSTPDR